MRLYRGMASSCSLRNPSWIPQCPGMGRWFTGDPAIAQWYADDCNGIIVVVDVPGAVAEAARLSNQPLAVRRYSADVENEYFLPLEWADRAR